MSLDIALPTIVAAYNGSMYGTDLFDQFGSYYDPRTRSIAWQMRIYTHFLRASCINANILYNTIFGTKLPLREFIQAVIAEWTNSNVAFSDSEGCSSESETFVEEHIDIDAEEGQNKSKKWWISRPDIRLNGHHWPLRCLSTVFIPEDNVVVDERIIRGTGICIDANSV